MADSANSGGAKLGGRFSNKQAVAEESAGPVITSKLQLNQPVNPFAAPAAPFSIGASAAASESASRAAPASAPADVELSEEWTRRLITRQFHVEVQGVPAVIDGKGEPVLVYSAVNASEMFGSRRKYNTEAAFGRLPASEKRTGNLDKVMIVSQELVNVNNGFPMALGVVATGGQTSIQDSALQPFHAITAHGLTGEKRSYAIKQFDANAFSTYSALCTEYKAGDFEKWETRINTMPDHLFVNMQSPVIKQIQSRSKNGDASKLFTVSQDIPNAARMETKIYEQEKQAILNSIQTQLPLVDVSDYQLVFTPTGGKSWSEAAALASGDRDAAKKTYTWAGTLNVTYYFAD